MSTQAFILFPDPNQACRCLQYGTTSNEKPGVGGPGNDAIASKLYRIAGNFRGRKLSRKFRGFVAMHESFLRKIWGVAFFGAEQASNPQKFSLWKSYFSPIRESFLPQKFPTIR